MSNFKLTPTHAPVKAYYETLEKCARGKIDNEGISGGPSRGCRRIACGSSSGLWWPSIRSRSGKSPLRVDAAVLDAFNLPRGCWEAKDEKDDLKAEMNKKLALVYPRAYDFGFHCWLLNSDYGHQR
jgi:hypothetical protein